MRTVVGLLCVALMSCTSRGAHCDVDGLQRALDRASPGDTVRVGRCRIDGGISVPDEVTLLGEANDAEEDNGIFVDEGTAVTLAPGATLRNVHVVSGGDTAVLVRGAGERTLQDLRVEIRRGAGLAVRGGTVAVSGSTFDGAVDDPMDPRFVRVAGFRVESACPDDLECVCTPGDVDGEMVCDTEGQWATWTAVYGIYAEDSTLTLTDVEISDVAEVGAAFINSTLQWNGGAVRGVVGVGSLVRGGSATVDSVRVESTSEGLRGLASYAWIAVDDAAITSNALTLADNDRYGFLNVDATGDHTDLVAQNNGDVGVWVQSDDFDLHGTGSMIEANGFAGVVVAQSDGVSIREATISGTSAVRRTLGDLFGAQEIGDGVHVSASSRVAMSNLNVLSNARGGIVVDLLGGMPTFDNVQVDVAAGGFGAQAGDRSGGDLTITSPGGWDTGIARTAAAEAADTDFMGVIDAIGVDAPETFRDRIGIVYPMF